MNDEPKRDAPATEINPDEEFDFTQLPSQQIDFTDVATPAGETEHPFEFTIRVEGLADRPVLLKTQIDAAVAERVLQGFLDGLLNLNPATEEDAQQWAEITAALSADPAFLSVVPVALAGLAEHMRAVSHIAYDLTIGYSLLWALIPLLEKSGGNAFRSATVQAMLKTVFERLLEPTRNLYFGMEQRLDERAASSSDISTDSDAVQ
jgi:hypothetical protein